ncbi:MAG: hypothetical protein ACYTAN_13540 [Planctomycetota bacterium]|jgi:hypothetical protein
MIGERKDLGPVDDPKDENNTQENARSEDNLVFGMELEAVQQLANKILVVIIHRSNEGIHHELTSSVGLWARLGMRVSLIQDPHGGFVEITRASVVNTFLEYTERVPDIEYLVMIDADEAVDASAPLLLARHNLPVVSGIVCGFNSKHGLFACFTAEDENGMPRFPCANNQNALPAQGLIKAFQVGTGLLCVRKDVFETMRAKKMEPFALDDWTRERSFAEGILKKGEDICFSERCEELGFDRWVDAEVHAGHQKVISLGWPQYLIDEKKDSDEFTTSRKDYGG